MVRPSSMTDEHLEECLRVSSQSYLYGWLCGFFIGIPIGGFVLYVIFRIL